jgi:hypothetical protein
MEMPRPTVRKWCEHGYMTAFEKTLTDLRTHFTPDSILTTADIVEEEPILSQEESEPVPASETINEEENLSQPPIEAGSAMDNIRLSISITLDEKPETLVVYQDQEPEDAVARFCREHLPDDLSGCIRQLLPDVLDRLSEAQA